MNKLTTLISLIFLLLNLNTSAQEFRLASSKVTHKYRYGFSDFKAGYSSSYRVSNLGFQTGRKIIIKNKTLIELFSIALGIGIPFQENEIIVELQDQNILTKKYCYELSVPAEMVDGMFVTMHQNLLHNFPDYEAVIQTRIVDHKNKEVLVIRDKQDFIILSKRSAEGS